MYPAERGCMAVVWPLHPVVRSTTRWNARSAASLVAKTPIACLTRWLVSVSDTWATAPLNEARSGSAYTSGRPMSAQLLHAGSSTEYDWTGSVKVDSNRIGAPTMLPTEPLPSTA